MNTIKIWQTTTILACTIGGALIAVHLTSDRGAIAATLYGALGVILGSGIGAVVAFNPAEAIAGFVRLLGKIAS